MVLDESSAPGSGTTAALGEYSHSVTGVTVTGRRGHVTDTATRKWLFVQYLCEWAHGEDITTVRVGGRDVRNENGQGILPLFTTSTCSLLDGSTKALRPRAQRIRHSLKTRKTARLNEYANMFPLDPALILAFVSFISSAFVILRILIPILPPHPLSRRVRPVSPYIFMLHR